MSRFTGDLAVSFVDLSGAGEGRTACLLQPLVWECDELGSGLIATVPTGFISDGATVPRLVWWLLPPWGDRATRAAVLHDYLCEMLDLGWPITGATTRRDCDRQFRLALIALAVNPLRAWLCWCGVRLWSISDPALRQANPEQT